MPIYEYYCSQNHTVYQFYAKSLAQGKLTPACPDNPAWPLKKVVSQFALTGLAKEPAADLGADTPAGEADDPRMEAAMSAMEKEFSAVDENDPRAMARMMRRMSEMTGETIDGEMEEVVRKLEEGVDPEKLEEQIGGGDASEGGPGTDDPYGMGGGMGGMGRPGGGGAVATEKKEARMRYKNRGTRSLRRDPMLYDYA
ncbi:MAG: FmdB family transcriptional regulator [Verrucomicrobia bacterium]|nr:MAG: FmdB family transcriptional regulator [Verrucomicrobiota bacterium]